MSATDVLGLSNQLTAVVVPTVGALVLAIVNFINHHVHSKKTEALTATVTNVVNKVENIDQQIVNQKANIAIGVDALSGIVPGLGTTLAGHSKQIADLSAQITALNIQLEKLRSAIPTTTLPLEHPPA